MRTALLVSVLVLSVGAAVYFAVGILPQTGEPVDVLVHPGGSGPASVDLDLTPGMSPLRAVLDLTRTYAFADNHLTGTFALTRPDGTVAWREELRLAEWQERGSGTASARRPVAVFYVTERGRYRLTASFAGSGVQSARVTVRRNVRVVDLPWLEAHLQEVGLDLPGVFAPPVRDTSRSTPAAWS